MNVTIHRGGGGDVVVPISVLHGFRVEPDLSHGRVRYRLSALMSCTDLPAGETFGHFCEHGPPPHTIRVLLLWGSHKSYGSSRLGRLRRAAFDAERLSEAMREGVVADA